MKPEEFKALKTVRLKVKYLLEKVPYTRENDMKLVGTYYLYEIGKEDVNKMSAMELLTLISTNKVPHFETIRKERQRVQKAFPELKTEQYGKRRKVQQVYFKVNIREK
jgi:hypothetical protein